MLDRIHGPASPDVIAVVCKDDAWLALLTRDTLAVRHRVPLTALGHEVTIDQRGARAYVPLYGTGRVGQSGVSGDGIDVIDLRAGRVVGTLPLPTGARPHDAAWGRGRTLHVTAEGLSSVLSVDSLSGRLTATHSTDHQQSHMLVTSPDRCVVYTANVHPGSLTALDLDSGRSRTVALAQTVNRVSLSPSGDRAYVADQDRPRLAVVDVIAMRLDVWLPLPGIAFGTAPSKDGRHVFVTLRHDSGLAVVDMPTGHVVLSPRLPRGPQRLVLDAQERMAYTACSPADAVVAVELASMTIASIGEVGPNPDGIALSSPPRERGAR